MFILPQKPMLSTPKNSNKKTGAKKTLFLIIKQIL